MKNNKGITLVALIITIIILIILAAVTIYSIVQTNLIEKSLYATESYEAEQKREDGILTSYDKELDKLTSSQLSADIVSFTPEDASWDVSTVQDALDYLYNH